MNSVGMALYAKKLKTVTVSTLSQSPTTTQNVKKETKEEILWQGAASVRPRRLTFIVLTPPT